MSGPIEAPIDVGRQVREHLETLERRYPLARLNTRVGEWTLRRTPGRSPEQTPVILLPGIQGGGDMFVETAMLLGDVLPLVLVDAPDIEDAAAITSALADVLHALRLSRVHLVGSSLGGYLAQCFALVYPSLIDQLIIANGYFDASVFTAKMPPPESFARMNAKALVEKNLQPLLDAHSKDNGQLRLEAVVQALIGTRQTFENYKSRLLLMMTSPPVRPVPIPADRVMLVDDDHDPTLPPEMRQELRNRYRDSEQHRIEGGGHLPAIQRPHEFAELVRGRLASLPTP